MLTFKNYLKEEAEGQKLTHLEHLEDLPLVDSKNGMKNVNGIVNHTISHIQAKKNDPSVAMKHDGSPSIVYGHHPETGKFFVASKSAFNKIPKINYTNSDIEKNHGQSKGLESKLKDALHHLPKIAPKKGVYQGDMLFSGNDKQESGRSVGFKPNVITYTADGSSEEGKKIGKAKFGLYTHTQYHGKDIRSMSADHNPDVSGFTEHPDVYHRLPGHDTSKVNLTQENLDRIHEHMAHANNIHKENPQMYSDIQPYQEHLKRYINHTVKQNIDPNHQGFVEHLASTHDKGIQSAKTSIGRQNKQENKETQLKHIGENKHSFEKFFKMHDHIQKAKDILVHTLSQHTDGLKHTIDGQKVKPEGFVVSHNGAVAKLNDRKEFNRLNFLARK